MATVDSRRLPPAAQEVIRRKAVKAVLDGMPENGVAAILGTTRQSIHRWMTAYRTAGEVVLGFVVMSIDYCWRMAHPFGMS